MSATLELLRAAQEGDRDACEQAVIENNGLIWSVVRRYYGRGVDPEDLYQLGCLGFLKAVQGFDFDYGTCFSTYAVPKIAGEIRRFLRDDGAVKVGRTMREQAQTLYTIRERLRQELGREPVLSELSEASGLTPEEIAQVAREWPQILGQTTGLLRTTLGKAMVTVSDNQELLLVFSEPPGSKDCSGDILQNTGALDELKGILEEHVGKKVPVKVEINRSGENSRQLYTDAVDYFAKTAHIDIEEEDF